MERLTGADVEKGGISSWVCKSNLHQLTKSPDSQVMNLGLILYAVVHKGKIATQWYVTISHEGL